MSKRIAYIKKFLQNEVWIINLDEVSKFKRAYIKFLRVITLGFIGFKEDKLNVRASALTYFTFLSIVPVFALGFGIAKGFGLDEVLERELTKNLAGQEQILEYILQFTRTMLNTAKGGIIAGVGLGLLLWSVIKLLTNIEDSFNTVWEVKKSRTFFRKFTDYMSIMLLGPIFFILSSSVTIFISRQLSQISAGEMFGFANPIFLKFAQIIPYFIIWILFTVLFMIMPNTKVNFKSALIAGIISGTIFQLFQVLYVFFQSGATRINTIYGSFAALPLFLIWLQMSWFVVLLGAEISYAVQNVKHKGASIINKAFSITYQKKIALFLIINIINRFEKGEKPYSAGKLSLKLKLPVYTIEYILQNLRESGIISQVIDIKGKQFYQPAKSINNIDFCDVIYSYEDKGIDNSKFIVDEEFLSLNEKIKEIKEFSKKSPSNILLKDFNKKI